MKLLSNFSDLSLLSLPLLVSLSLEFRLDCCFEFELSIVKLFVKTMRKIDNNFIVC